METLGSKQVYANPWMAVREDAIRHSDGSTGIYGVVDSPDIALIIPAEGRPVASRRAVPVPGRRPALGFPLRKRRPTTRRRRGGAGRTRAARRRLVTSRLTPRGTLDVAPGMFSQRCRVFLATDLTRGAPQRELEEHDMRSAWFTRADVERMINDGTITDAKSIAAYTLLLLQGQTSHVSFSGLFSGLAGRCRFEPPGKFVNLTGRRRRRWRCLRRRPSGASDRA